MILPCFIAGGVAGGVLPSRFKYTKHVNYAIRFEAEKAFCGVG